MHFALFPAILSPRRMNSRKNHILSLFLENTFIQVTVGFVSVIVLGIFFGLAIPSVIKQQQIRDNCYKVGVATMPQTTDQSLIQGVPAYKACIKNAS